MNKRARSYRMALLLGTVLGIGLSSTAADAQVRDGYLGAMIRYPTALTGGVTYTFETRNMVSTVAGTPDTVMYLLNTTTGTFLAFDDDGNSAVQPFASRIVYTAPAGALTSVLVVVSSYSETSRGTAGLYVNGVQKTSGNFGGVRYSVGWNATTTIVDTVLKPNGSSDTVLFLIPQASGGKYFFDDDSGLGYASRIIPTSSCTGACTILVGAYGSNTEGQGRVIRNDPTVDGDEDLDGLSNVVEADPLIRTSSKRSDTDYDGINDYFEVIGKPTTHASGPAIYSRSLQPGGSDGALLLPQMDAHPTARDIFVMPAYQLHDGRRIEIDGNSDGPLDWASFLGQMNATFSAHNASPAVLADPTLAVHFHIDSPVAIPANEHADFVILKRHEDPFTYGNDACAAAPTRDVRTLFPGKTFVNFFAVRAKYMPAIRDGVFNFALFAHSLFDLNRCSVNLQRAAISEASLGNPERPLLGDNMVVLGASYPRSNGSKGGTKEGPVAMGTCNASDPTSLKRDEAMLGLTLHELGHLYGLTHVGNESYILDTVNQTVDVSQNSSIHRSVMNYGFGVCGFCSDPAKQPLDPSCPGRLYTFSEGVKPYPTGMSTRFNPEVGADLNCRDPSTSQKWQCLLEGPREWCDCDSADQTNGAPNPQKSEWRMLGTRPELSKIW